MNRVLLLLFGFLFGTAAVSAQDLSPNLLGERDALRTIYQQAGPYSPFYDIKTDGVMVYGVSDADTAGYPEWAERSGSILQVMTGIAWGEYQNYLDGKWDGINHWEDAQVDGAGKRVLHGSMESVPYICPSISFCDYLIERLKKVVDAGVDSIYLEEPEFWAFSGYGESFRREWRMFYNEELPRLDSSCDAQYRGSVLKAHLYRRAIDKVGTALKEYALKTQNRPLKIFIATHSLVSYAQIRMVSPEATLMDLPGIDGLIAQIWTGTSRSPNYYEGRLRERTFESALLEYGVMAEMVRGTGKRIYFLNDPVEDDPNHDWNDYRRNYLGTLVASLMRSATADYEVAPWPSRIFMGQFPAGSPDAAGIPADYASVLNVGFQQLRDMDQKEVSWNGSPEGIGVLLSDSAMFQRGEPKLWEAASSDPPGRESETSHERERMNGFFSLTMPLLKGGIPVEVPVLDHTVRYPGYLDLYRVLVLSYEFQKPLVPGIHAELADWVRRGGVLVYVGAGSDPFLTASGWWNRSSDGRTDETADGTADSAAKVTCDQRLLESLGLDRDCAAGEYAVGKGYVILVRTDPAYYGRTPEGAAEYRNLIKRAAQLGGIEDFTERNYLLKSRGPYTLAACLDESISAEPLVLTGHFVDLFDAALPVLNEVTLEPGMQKWLLDLDRVSGPETFPLACGGRILNWKVSDGGVICRIESIQGVNIVSRWRLAQKPVRIMAGDAEITDWTWDEGSRTVYFTYHSESAEGIQVSVTWKN